MSLQNQVHALNDFVCEIEIPKKKMFVQWNGIFKLKFYSWTSASLRVICEKEARHAEKRQQTIKYVQSFVNNLSYDNAINTHFSLVCLLMSDAARFNDLLHWCVILAFGVFSKSNRKGIERETCERVVRDIKNIIG